MLVLLSWTYNDEHDSPSLEANAGTDVRPNMCEATQTTVECVFWDTQVHCTRSNYCFACLLRFMQLTHGLTVWLYAVFDLVLIDTRGLVSLQARQGGSGGSRGNPPSGPTSARKATPAPARHLSFPHSSPDSHTQPSSSARAGWISPDPIPDGVASPTLSLPTPRAPKAAPHSPRPHRVSDKTPSIRARANLSSPGVTQAASPTLSLPSPKAPRAAPSSPALDPQLQESVHLSSKPFGLVQAPDAAVSADCLFSAEGTSIVEDQMVAEVFVLSEIWKVFEQVVKQVTPPLSAPAAPIPLL